jgi:predicted GIY-YIG superfamily endonuclease
MPHFQLENKKYSYKINTYVHLQKDTDKVYIYLVTSTNGAVKIGITCNIKNRLNGIRTSCPMKIDILGYCQVKDREFAINAERRIHSVLSADRLSGEWFSCSIEKAIDTIRAECGDFSISTQTQPRPRGRRRIHPEGTDRKTVSNKRLIESGGAVKQFRLSCAAIEALAEIREKHGIATDTAVIEWVLINQRR